jgi:NAD(P)H-hydrate epimerase
METVVTSAQMQACDRAATVRMRIPSLLLMEHAGAGVARSMLTRYAPPHGCPILILCGMGKNGGDGLVAARHLYNAAMAVTVVLLGTSSQLKGDSRTSYRILSAMAKKAPNDQPLRIMETRSLALIKRLPQAAYIIDALFGTGFSGEMRGVFPDLIEWINTRQAKRISIDLPSGLNADDGSATGSAVMADLTLTMGSKKIGLMVGQGRSYAGEIQVVDLGITQDLLRVQQPAGWVVERRDVRSILPTRKFDAHKQSVGKLLILAGSRGMSGAAALAAASALRSGAGVVVLGTPASIASTLDRKLTEVMVEPLPETPKGTLSVEAFESIRDRLRWADLVILGPGLSRHPETVRFVLKCLREISLPMLVDADGLNALSEEISALRSRRSREVIITPHGGELARLLGSPSVERDRVRAATETAKKFRLTVLLKGSPTLVADERGELYINSTGNPGMATAGAGDVLSGCIGALWGQGMKRTEAAYAGAFVHGLAGDLARIRFGERGLTASDIEQQLPQALRFTETATAR